MTPSERPLVEAKRQAVVDHVLTATRRFVVAHGLDATMDQIAEAAAVSRRTLFRLFGSRERLIAAAFAAGMANYSREMPAFDGDGDRWLRATCDGAHRMNAAFGPGYWELTSRTDLPPDLAAIEQRRRQRQSAWAADVTRVLWRATGGDVEPPETLVATVGAHLSSHFTAAVMTDAGHDWQVAADLAHDAIVAALRHSMAVAVDR